MQKHVMHHGAAIYFHRYRCLREACKLGHIEIVKWLYELGADIYVYDNICFRHACRNGQLEIAAWLYDINANTHHNYSIALASKNNHVDIIEWLYKINPMNLLSSKAFVYACHDSSREVINWWCERDPNLLVERLGEIPLRALKIMKLSSDSYDILKFIKRALNNSTWFYISIYSSSAHHNVKSLECIIKNLDYIEDIIVHAIYYYKLDAIAQIIQEKFQHIAFVIENRQIMSYDILKSSIKNARKI